MQSCAVMILKEVLQSWLNLNIEELSLLDLGVRRQGQTNKPKEKRIFIKRVMAFLQNNKKDNFKIICFLIVFYHSITDKNA